MKINWKVRANNPTFWIQLVVSVVVAILAPVLTYAGMTGADVTSWAILWQLITDALKNPYELALIAVSVWHCITDPTTKGLGDSNRALTYDKPFEDKADTEAPAAPEDKDNK